PGAADAGPAPPAPGRAGSLHGRVLGARGGQPPAPAQPRGVRAVAHRQRTTPMQEAEKIRKLRTSARAVLAAVQAEPPVTDPAVERLFQEIRAAAEETVRRAGAPVKIGVVGEFNAGKSLLLRSLIGYAAALPITA